MDQLTDLIDKFENESKVSYPRIGDWMLLDINICKPQVIDNEVKSTSTTDEFVMKPEAVTETTTADTTFGSPIMSIPTKRAPVPVTRSVKNSSVT